MRLLFIAYHYPPSCTSASNRTGNLSHYLAALGWDITVLTTPHSKRDLPSFDGIVNEVSDPGIFEQVRRLFFQRAGNLSQVTQCTTANAKRTTSVTRGPIRRWLYETLCFPDEQAGWRKPALKAAKSLAAQEPFDIVWSSSAPQTSHLIARYLKRHGDARYWIADLRDLWTQNHFRQYTRFRDWAETRLEKRTFSDADLLVTVSKPMAQNLAALHPHTRVEVVTNGFTPQERSKEPPMLSTFKILYTGQLYRGRRDPSILFKAIHQLEKAGQCTSGEIHVSFFVNDPSLVRDIARKIGLEANISVSGWVAREEINRAQREATVLLLLNWDHPAEVGTYSGKVFEYFDAERPILAVGGPAGVLTELLARTGTGYHTQSMEELKQVLLRWLKEFRSEGTVRFTGNSAEIAHYYWANLAKQYSALMHQVLENELRNRV